MGLQGNGATSNREAARLSAPLELPNEMDACLRLLTEMTEELRAALLANDVERVRDVSDRQAEWAAAVSAKLRDGSLTDGGRPEAVRQLAEGVSREMAINEQLLEDGLSVARFALGAMTGADDSGGLYSPDGTIRGQDKSRRASGGSPSSRIVQKTV